jgi:hypothetical protein
MTRRPSLHDCSRGGMVGQIWPQPILVVNLTDHRCITLRPQMYVLLNGPLKMTHSIQYKALIILAIFLYHPHAGVVIAHAGVRPTSCMNGITPIARAVQGTESSLAPLRRTVASVPPCSDPSPSPDTRPSSAASAARQEADGCFSPGSLPPGAVCSISALISPPIRTKRPVTYIQVSSTMTAPMLP